MPLPAFGSEYEPEYDANEPDDAAMPVIVCAGCGATVFADFPSDRYCLDCEAHLIWSAAGRPLPEPEPLAVDWNDVPF